MRIENMTSVKGNKVPNQFIISEKGNGANGNFITRNTFQSYDSIIAIITKWDDRTDTELDATYWDYSRTTGKYRNLFLGEGIEETREKIKKGDYKLINLNN